MTKSISHLSIRLEAAYECGDLDAYYGRDAAPHYNLNSSGHAISSKPVDGYTRDENLTDLERAYYLRGYRENPAGQKE